MITMHSVSAAYVKANQTEIDPRDVTTQVFTNNSGIVSMSLTHRPTGVRVSVDRPKSRHEAERDLRFQLADKVFPKPTPCGPGSAFDPHASYEPHCLECWADSVAGADDQAQYAEPEVKE